MQKIIGTTAEKVTSSGRARPIIQNLGPGIIYIDTDGNVDAASGLVLPPGTIIEFSSSGANENIWLVSSLANTDVRVIEMG